MLRKALAAALLLIACLGCGKTVETTPPTAPAPPAKRVPFQKDGKWGFTDDAGRAVVAPVYDGVGEFSEGLAAVNVGGTRRWPGPLEGGRWGYVDEKGTLVIPLKWTHAQPFSEGLALVLDGHERCYIDRTGKTVIRLEGVGSAGSFREGLAPTWVDRSLDGLDWQTRYVDRAGKTALVVEGHAQEFHEGLAVLSVRVGDERRCGFIDQKGEVVIAPVFAEARHFSEGLAAVRPEKTGPVYGKGDRWGYIDRTGQFAIGLKFNEAHPFAGGVARVHVGGKLVHVATHQPMGWKGGEWQLIDRTGRILKRSPEWNDVVTSN